MLFASLSDDFYTNFCIPTGTNFIEINREAEEKEKLGRSKRSKELSNVALLIHSFDSYITITFLVNIIHHVNTVAAFHIHMHQTAQVVIPMQILE